MLVLLNWWQLLRIYWVMKSHKEFIEISWTYFCKCLISFRPFVGSWFNFFYQPFKVIIVGWKRFHITHCNDYLNHVGVQNIDSEIVKKVPPSYHSLRSIPPSPALKMSIKWITIHKKQQQLQKNCDWWGWIILFCSYIKTDLKV